MMLEPGKVIIWSAYLFRRSSNWIQVLSGMSVRYNTSSVNESFVARCIGTIRLRSVYIFITVHPHLYINPPVGLHAQGRHPNQHNHAWGSDLRRRCRAYQSIPHQVDTVDQAS